MACCRKRIIWWGYLGCGLEHYEGSVPFTQTLGPLLPYPSMPFLVKLTMRMRKTTSSATWKDALFVLWWASLRNLFTLRIGTRNASRRLGLSWLLTTEKNAQISQLFHRRNEFGIGSVLCRIGFLPRHYTSSTLPKLPPSSWNEKITWMSSSKGRLWKEGTFLNTKMSLW